MSRPLRFWLFIDMLCISLGLVISLVSLAYFTPWTFLTQIALGGLLGGVGLFGYLFLVYLELKQKKMI